MVLTADSRADAAGNHFALEGVSKKKSDICRSFMRLLRLLRDGVRPCAKKLNDHPGVLGAGCHLSARTGSRLVRACPVFLGPWCCRSIGAEVLIDDNPAYAVECAQAGIQVLLYDWQLSYPWGKTPDGPTHDLITRWVLGPDVFGCLDAHCIARPTQ